MGDRLKEFRQINNLTQQELANYLGDGVGKAFISQIEHGTRNLPVAHFAKLIDNPYGWDTTMLQEDAKQSSMFVDFLSANSIDIVDLAKYLGLSKAYMSQIVSGASKLADSRYQMLIDNPYGWDTSMLSREQNLTPQNQYKESNYDNCSNTYIELQYAKQTIEVYKKLLDELKEQNDFLRKLINKNM